MRYAGELLIAPQEKIRGAYVLIKASPGSLREVHRRLKSIEGVKRVYSVIGETCDFVVKIEGVDFSALSKIILQDIRQIRGVDRTHTLLLMGD